MQLIWVINSFVYAIKYTRAILSVVCYRTKEVANSSDYIYVTFSDN